MKDEKRSFMSLKNNARGKFFEKAIEMACDYYREQEIANIHKVPEPYRVIKKFENGEFKGQFLKKAEPDFKGCLRNGQQIVFECKSTTKERIIKSILSENQKKELYINHKLKCITSVCICFEDELIERYFFVPFFIWEDMEKYYKKKSLTKDDLHMFEVYYKPNIGIHFLENILK